MNFDDPDFLRNLREALRNIPDDGPPRRQAMRMEPLRNVDEFKVNELPEFIGGTDPEVYLEWERKIDRMFDFKDLDDGKRCKYAILKLGKGASLWFEGLKAQRARAGKDKITSWDSLKRKLRKRYVPTSHRLTLYRKISDLVQGRSSVMEYIDEFENLSLMSELEENEEQKMARFLRGLNRNIANSVELYPYADFDTLCGLCVKLENQGVSKFRTTDRCGAYTDRQGWSKPEFSSEFGAPSNSSNPTMSPKAVNPARATSNIAPKLTNPANETSLSKVRCFKCQGFGHFQNACPNKRVVTLREAVEVRDELFDEEERLGDVFNLKEVEGETEDVVTYEAPIYDTMLVVRSLHAQSESVSPGIEQRDQLFQTKCQVKGKWCSVIIDGGSCTNAASSEMVSKLALPTTAHPKPYTLQWLDDDKRVQVSKQVRVCFAMGSYTDEVLCDVVPMDACHILLGRPWQYDRDVMHKGRSNEYVLSLNDKQFVLKPMSSRAARAMSSGRGRNPSLTMLAIVEEREFELGKEEFQGNNVTWSIDFNRPPIFDDYDDEEAIDSNVKSPRYSFNSDYELELFAKPTENTIDSIVFQVRQGCYSPIGEPAHLSVRDSSCLHSWLDNEVRDRLSWLVHGGWWGGWHKEFSRVFLYDPGGLKLQELRSIPFKGGGDDPSPDTMIGTKEEELVLVHGAGPIGTNNPPIGGALNPDPEIMIEEELVLDNEDGPIGPKHHRSVAHESSWLFGPELS